ncbi:hypothetical protein KXZ64_27395, partial [Klebsiella pneumoniae]|nr:hypothetical protein [Klebsiella pneumoniae]
KSAQIREILISESAWEEMTCLFAPSQEEDRRTLELFQGRKYNQRQLLCELPHLYLKMMNLH